MRYFAVLLTTGMNFADFAILLNKCWPFFKCRIY